MRLVVFAALLLHSVHAANILVFIPFPMKSHHIAFQPIVRELAERGHTVTYLTSVQMEKPHPKGLTEVLVPNVLGLLQKDVLTGGFLEFGRMPTALKSWHFSKIGQLVMDTTLAHPEAQKIINSNEKYDVVIHEAFFVSEAVVALQHKFNAPGVALMPLADSSWLSEMSGLPDNPSYMVDFKTDFPENLSFLERLHNTYHLASTIIVSYFHMYLMQGLMDKHFKYQGYESRAPISKLLANQSLILVNSHHSVGYNYPKAPHVKEVGGINIRTPKPLPEDLEKLLNDSPQGVIYLSLGSNVNMADVSRSGVREAFSNVFGNLKERVLWKWTGKDFPQVPDNVYMSDWFPQQDILAHKNVKIFISHGGLLSTTESVNNAVPIIGIPFFADQKKNLRQATSAGFGLRLDYENLTETSISWAINEVLNNERYKKQALKHQALFLDRIMSPVKESVYWIEYVLRHGNVLQPSSVHLPFYQVYLLDVLITIISAMLVAIYIVKISVNRLCCRKKQNKVKRKTQ